MYGPHEIRRGAGIQVNTEAVVVNCQYSMAVFSAGERKRRPRGDRKSQEMTMHLRQVCLITLFFVGPIPTQGALTPSNCRINENKGVFTIKLRPVVLGGY